MSAPCPDAYAVLKAWGHSASKAAEIALDASRGDGHSLRWVEGARRSLRDSDASLAEDAKRLSPEGVAARAEGIAHPQVHPHKDS